MDLSFEISVYAKKNLTTFWKFQTKLVVLAFFGTFCTKTSKHCQSNFIQVTTKGLGAKMQSLSLTGTTELSMCSATHKGFNICSEYLNATLAMNSGTNMPFRFENFFLFSLYFKFNRNLI